MAVGKIEYKKILNDEDFTPTKLKDLYVSQLHNDPYTEQSQKFVESPEERYTIMTPEAAAALIASRQQKEASAEISEPEIEVSEEQTTEEVTEPKKFDPITGGTWMPMVLDEQTNPSKFTFSNAEDFVRKMTDVYRKELVNRGYDPAFAEYIVAQDGLESAWGEKQSGANNFGGIKVDTSDLGKNLGTIKTSDEWDGQKMTPQKSEFRNFKDLKDYVNYKINFVNRNRYNVFAYSPEEYFERMKAGGYATDPNYVSKLNNVLQTVRKYS